MPRLKEKTQVVPEENLVPLPESDGEPQIICGIDVSKLEPFTSEAELPPAIYRTKVIKGKKTEVLVEKGAPRYFTQQNGQEMIQIRRGFHRVERRWFCRIKTKDPNWRAFIEAIRKRGIREEF
jgi:hypothetical protein